MLGQLRGHNRRGEEEQLKKWREKKDRSQEGRREKKMEGRVETEWDHLIYIACVLVSSDNILPEKSFFPLFYLNRKPHLVHSLWSSLLSTSCLQPFPQGLLVSLLEAAAA